MEALSPTMEEGRLVEWKKSEGEPVAVGDVLAEVETDKAVMELVARAGGTLLKQVVPAGATVPVSELVALIGEPGEAVENGKPAPAQEQQATQPTPGASARSAAGAARAPRRPRAARSPGRRAAPPARAPATARSAGPRQGVAARAPDRGRARHRSRRRRRHGPRGPGRAPRPRGTRRRPPRGAAAPAAGAAAPVARPPAVAGPRRRALHRRAAHPDPEDDRPAAGPVDRPDPDVLPHDRGGHGAGAGTRARRSRRWATARRCRSTTSSSRRSPPRCGSIRRATPGGRTTGSATGTRCTSSMAVAIEDGLITPVIRHADLKSLREIAAESHDLAAPRARAPAQARGVHRRHVLGLEPRHARHRRVHRGHQPAGGRDPGGRPDRREGGGARGAARASGGGCGSPCPATTG